MKYKVHWDNGRACGTLSTVFDTYEDADAYIDEIESLRRAMLEQLNSSAGERPALEAEHGQVWDTAELQRDFSVENFLAPFVLARRKSDGKLGTLMFQHMPRYYFDFKGEDE